MEKTEAKKIKIDKQFFAKYMYVFSIIIVFAIFTAITPSFMTPYSLQNLMTEIAPLMLMAGGISFVIFTGGIDLGAGATVSCTCVLTGLYISMVGTVIIIPMIIAGMIMGFINGLIVTKLKLPSFIVTLCTTNFWACIALKQAPDGSVAIPMNARHVVAWATQKVLGIPALFIIALVGLLVLYIFQSRTVYGRTIMAVGANVRSARMAGVDTDKAQMAAFMICSTFSSLAGVLYAYKLKSAVPTVGNSLTLSAIASVALGGTSMAGGMGSVLRTAMGVITITAVNSGLTMIGLDALWKDIVVGIILIISVILNSDTSGRDIIVK